MQRFVVHRSKQAQLILKDGTSFSGYSFGANTSSSGEVVFSTGMVGYPQSLTDPSYYGQMLIFTYPLIGNYGVSNRARDRFGLLENFESEKIQPRAVIVGQYISNFSHYGAQRSLSEWLVSEGVSGITGVDTRALTRHLRAHGTMLGKILVGKEKISSFFNPDTVNVVDQVSSKVITIYNSRGKKGTLLFIDCGAKINMLRELCNRDFRVIRIPWDFDFLNADFQYDGIVISNGPGNPKQCGVLISRLRAVIQRSSPILGICLGHQLLSLAAGADTYKLKYGHRGQNQPCVDVLTDKVYITTQNHGFAVRRESLPRGWKLWFVNANDGTVEGIRHARKRFMGVQFHPEATPGPEDAYWIFDEFIKML